MKTVHDGVAAAALALAVSACAASPEDIKPRNISTAPYAYLTCVQLADYKITLTKAYDEAADSENNARTVDAVTIVAIGLPAGSMFHENVPMQISELKGRIAAVEKLQAQDNCAGRQPAK
jgi:uncharacterized protein (DUF697 family)